MISKKLGTIIRERRKALGITAEELAKKVGIDRTFVSKIENDKLLPSSQVLERIGKILKTNSLIEPYVNQKSPFFKQYATYTFNSIPSAIRHEFKTVEQEQLLRFIFNNVETPSASLKEDCIDILKGIAPEKEPDKKLINQVLDLIMELKADRDAYWKIFNTYAKQVESLVIHKATAQHSKIP